MSPFLLFSITAWLSIFLTFSTEINTIITPQTIDNPYALINEMDNNDIDSLWTVHSSKPLSIKLTNLTIFHPSLTSTVNITMYSTINQLSIGQSMDVIVTFIFDSKYFTMKINIDTNSNQNTKISPQCGSPLSSQNDIITLLTTDNVITSKWDQIVLNNGQSKSELSSTNQNTFPLLFSIENNPTQNTMNIMYISNNNVQKCSFTEIQDISPQSITQIMINTDIATQSVNLTRFDINYHIDDNDEDIINAEYSLIIRNININDLYTETSMINERITSAINEYFGDNDSRQYIIMISDFLYDTDKSDTNIVFTLQKSDNIWSNNDISKIYASYTDSQFYYLITLHLELVWPQSDSTITAQSIQQLYIQGKTLQVNRDYIDIELTDFPFANVPEPDITTTDNNEPATSIQNEQNVENSISTTTYNKIINPNNNILADSSNAANEATSNQIMSWTTFAIIVTILLILIGIVGILILCINQKTATLESLGQIKEREYRKHFGTGTQSKSQQGVVPIPQSPSVECMPIHQNAAEKISAERNRGLSGGIGSEGRRASELKQRNGNRGRPPMIALNNGGKQNGLGQINENIAQPPSVNIADIGRFNNALGMPAQNNLKMGKQASMEFDVHISDVVVADEIVMNDIVQDMNDEQENDDDMVMMADVETPAGMVETPGGDDVYNNAHNLMQHAKGIPVPDDTDEDQSPDDEDVNEDNAAVQYYGNLTPDGGYNEDDANSNNGGLPKFGIVKGNKGNESYKE